MVVGWACKTLGSTVSLRDRSWLTSVGQLLASGVAIPLGRIASDYSWRIPLLLQCALAVVNVAFVLLLPESPRWLFSRGRKEEAVIILAQLHTRDNDPQSPLVQL